MNSLNEKIAAYSAGLQNSVNFYNEKAAQSKTLQDEMQNLILDINRKEEALQALKSLQDAPIPVSDVAVADASAE